MGSETHKGECVAGKGWAILCRQNVQIVRMTTKKKLVTCKKCKRMMRSSHG